MPIVRENVMKHHEINGNQREFMAIAMIDDGE